jgi:hypothetical protein
MSALPPITLKFTIRISSTPQPPTIYDIPVVHDDPIEIFTDRYRASNSPQNAAFLKSLKEITDLDKDIALAVQGMHFSKGKTKFYNNYADDPVTFLKKWIDSQRYDSEIIMGEELGRGVEWTRDGPESVWAGDTARESVSLVLARTKPPGA